MHIPLVILISLVAIIALAVLLRAVAEDFSDEHDGPTPVPKITARAVEKLAFVGGTDTGDRGSIPGRCEISPPKVSRRAARRPCPAEVGYSRISV